MPEIILTEEEARARIAAECESDLVTTREAYIAHPNFKTCRAYYLAEKQISRFRATDNAALSAMLDNYPDQAYSGLVD